MVGHGGSVKYDPTIAKEATRVLALSNRAALFAVQVEIQHAGEHGRAAPGDLKWFQALRSCVTTTLEVLGLDVELDNARLDPTRKTDWLKSRRSVAAKQRSTEGDAEASTASEDGGLFAGPQFLPEREQQFEQLLAADREMRSRQLDVPNPSRPAFCATEAEWRTHHMRQPAGVNIVLSAARARVPRQNLRATTVPWDQR